MDTLAARLTAKEWVFSSPGIAFILLGIIGLDNGWAHAYWLVVAGFAYTFFVGIVLYKGYLSKEKTG